jgi:hypothetical protein
MIRQTEHLDIFETDEFSSPGVQGSFSAPRRLYVGFPNDEEVCHNMRPLLMALVATWPSLDEPGRIFRVFIDRLEIARDSCEDYVDPIDMVDEFLDVLNKHIHNLEEFRWQEADPANLLEQYEEVEENVSAGDE